MSRTAGARVGARVLKHLRSPPSFSSRAQSLPPSSTPSSASSFTPSSRGFLTSFESLQPSSQVILPHSQITQNQYFSNGNCRGIGSSSCACDSTAQERFCTIPCRTYVTSYKKGLDGDEAVASSGPSTASQTREDLSACASPEAGTETTPSVNVAVDSAFKASPRHDMALLFTCTVCDVRSAKTMSRATYESGVVIVRCPGCQNLHLIADRYGWFGEPGSVEDFLGEKGIDVRKGSDSSYEFTVEDMAGWTPKGTA